MAKAETTAKQWNRNLRVIRKFSSRLRNDIDQRRFAALDYLNRAG